MSRIIETTRKVLDATAKCIRVVIVWPFILWYRAAACLAVILWLGFQIGVAAAIIVSLCGEPLVIPFVPVLVVYFWDLIFEFWQPACDETRQGSAELESQQETCK